jgi:hypothetical protein
MIRSAALALSAFAGIAGTAFAQVGGKTYSGTHDAGRGGAATFKLSDDGERVVAYAFPAVDGDTCTFKAQGDEGVWEGATLAGDGSFRYAFYDRIVIVGRFDGRTATGTIRLKRIAASGAPACDTGSVAWSVATPGEDPPPLPGATPTPTPAPHSDPGGGSPGGSAPGKRTATVSVALRRTRKTITGRVNSSDAACRSKRRLTLMNGKRVAARATTRSDGRFSIKRSSKTRNKRVRIAIASLKRSSTLTCAAATSVTIRG